MSGIDESESDLRCSNCGSISFYMIHYGYKETSIKLTDDGKKIEFYNEGDWGSTDYEDWVCKDCGDEVSGELKDLLEEGNAIMW